MAQDQKQEPTINIPIHEGREEDADRELDPGSEEPGTPLPLTVTSRVLYMLGDLTVGPAYRFSQWLELVRKRTSKARSSGFPPRLPRPDDDMPLSEGESNPDSRNPSFEKTTEISLWERLGKADMVDVGSSSFSWGMLSSLHHTEHSGSTDQSEDDPNKALEVTVNSGGVVFFALFGVPENEDSGAKEAAAVVKISSSRMATQSERLGYEFAKWLGVKVPQARVIHNSGQEWLQIKEAAEKARDIAISDKDEVGEMTCSELIEALELSRCLFLMSYVHGCPLLENPNTFYSQKSAEKIAASLGRILMLDLVIRNEDRLPCRQLGWRGNSANLLLADKMASAKMDALQAAYESSIEQSRPRVSGTFQKERKSTSAVSRLHTNDIRYESQRSHLSEILGPPVSSKIKLKEPNEKCGDDIHIVAIDSGVPRRPPAGKRASDQENYPKLIELLLNSSTYSLNLLHEITGGKLGSSLDSDTENDQHLTHVAPIVHAFQSGFRGALRDLQSFHIFLLTLHQKLDNLLRSFLGIINRASLGDFDREDMMIPESPQFAAHCPSPYNKDCPSPYNKEHGESSLDSNDTESQKASRQPSSGNKETSDSTSPNARESWHGKFFKGNGEAVRSLRLTAKLRDFHKYAKVDAELSKEMEQWTDMLKSEAVKWCHDNNFNTGFFEGSDNNSVVDAYELKVRLEHILERISLISDAANTEKPSLITSSMFIGGALAASSVHTLQHFGVTHILCLCSNEIGQSDSQYPLLFEYKNFSISDEEDTNISSIFGEGCDFIDHVEQSGGKVLVHCFEGRSRSATMVLAYLMLRKNMTLLQAWNTLKKTHRRAQPNDGFAKILLDLDKKLHGKTSMEWQQRKPAMKVCPICGKNAGLSSSSLKLHLQKSHKKLSSGSVDSAMTLEIQKMISTFKINRGGSVSPTQRDSSMSD